MSHLGCHLCQYRRLLTALTGGLKQSQHIVAERGLSTKHVPNKETVVSDEAVNHQGIQMLSSPLYEQVFKDLKDRSQRVDASVLSEITSHLKKHGLHGKQAKVLREVDFRLPDLHGANIDEHFRTLASRQLEPYLECVNEITASRIPPMPSEWRYAAGWTKYSTDGHVESVPYPEDSALVFDVEVLMEEGNFPTMATAVSPTAWYSWCSEAVISDIFRWTSKPQLEDLIPLESRRGQHLPQHSLTPRLLIGHNVGFDRSFITEQYFIEGTKMRFLDTMSLHIAISGLTSYQRILYNADKIKSRRKEVREMEENARIRGPPSTRWLKESTLNNLKDVYKLHCGENLEKATREVFIEGTMQDVRTQFQELMTYCATDVKATHAVFCQLWPQFLSRFPHPVTLAGMLEMGTTYLPINTNWDRYIESAEASFSDLQGELQLSLMRLADEACQLFYKKRYKTDPWLWDLDWSTRNFNAKRLPKQKSKDAVNIEDLTEEERVSQVVECAKKLMPKLPVHMAGYPRWYAELCPRHKELLSSQESYEDITFCYGPSKLSVQRRVTPKLLRMTWEGFPLHYDETHGWGYLLPRVMLEQILAATKPDDLLSEHLSDDEDGDDDNTALLFPYRQMLVECWPALLRVKQSHTDTKSQQQISQLEVDLRKMESQMEGGSLSAEEHAKISVLYLSKQRQVEKLAEKKLRQVRKKTSGMGAVWHTGDGPYDINIPSVWFYKLPHKDGTGNRVGNPLAKDFLSQVEDKTLQAARGAEADHVLKLNKMCAYWKNNRDRIQSQMVVTLNKSDLPDTVTGNDMYDEESMLGAILPRLVTAGTVTRRAVEPTWLTASNAYSDRVGSELKAMIQSPPGYQFVGADVDSQELWIAAVLGDAHFAKIHGCTAFGWMTLQGQKSEGTDLHSKTAALVGISRDQAKVFNYGRIYGAGRIFAERLLLQFNHRLSSQDAKVKARAMYLATKGERTRAARYKKYTDDEDGDDQVTSWGQWQGGSESHMFNKLESIAQSPDPRTPVLGCKISKALEPKNVNQDFMTSRVNWVVQSSAVDYLHLMLVCMSWLFEEFNINGRFCVSIHDEVRYLVASEDKHHAALALQITNLLTRSMFAYKLGMKDLPQSVAFFSTVDIDSCLRKEVNLNCETPSNPGGLQANYGLPNGEALDIHQILEKTGGSLRRRCNKLQERTSDTEDDPADYFSMMS